MDLQLQGKHILITGGSKGIGLACAREFCREGAAVTLVARDASALDEAVAALLREGAQARGVSADLRDAAAAADAVSRIADRHGEVDVLVNSAGAALRTPVDELTPQAWHDAMAAKFFTYVHVIDPVIRRMAAAGGGAVVNVVGAGGKIASPTHLPGGSANAALMLASAGYAAAYGPRGVRVNVVNPGLTLTGRLAQGLRAEAAMQSKTEQQVREAHEARIPLRRLATPEEIADAVVYLASPRASYITGAVIAMDGGVSPIVV